MNLEKNFGSNVGYLQVFAAAFIWGSYGLFVRGLDYSPEFILFYCFFFGFSGLLIYVSLREGLTWVKPCLANWKWMILPSCLTGLSWLAYTYSINFTSVSNAAFLIYTAPVFTVIFAPLIIKERLEVRTIVALIISILGTMSIMGYSTLFSSGLSLIGDLIALAGGMTYGLLALYLKRLPPGVLGLKSNIVLSAYIALALLPFVLISAERLNLKGFFLLMVLGLLQQTFAATLFHLGLRSIKAQHAGIMTYIEPLAATVLAALFLHEGISAGSMLGGALIITAGLLIVTRKDQV